MICQASAGRLALSVRRLRSCRVPFIVPSRSGRVLKSTALSLVALAAMAAAPALGAPPTLDGVRLSGQISQFDGCPPALAARRGFLASGASSGGGGVYDGSFVTNGTVTYGPGGSARSQDDYTST